MAPMQRRITVSEDFSGLFDKDTNAVALAPGETLFQKGDPGHTMYVVKSGELQILDGNHVHQTVTAGGILGEMALVDGAARSATVRALVPSVVVPIDERRFLFMVQQTPFFALRVMRVMSARLRAMNERVRT